MRARTEINVIIVVENYDFFGFGAKKLVIDFIPVLSTLANFL